jgi:thioredoxin-related protein
VYRLLICLLTLLPATLPAQQPDSLAPPLPQAPANPPPTRVVNIDWKDNLEQAMSQGFIHNKPILVYVYSQYCGFCHLTNTHTLTHPDVAQYIGFRFIPARLDASSTRPLWFMGQQYTYDTTARMHALAHQLLDGDTRFPTWVVMNRLGEIIAQVPGYLKAPDLRRLLAYYGEGAYMTMTWEEFSLLTHF